VLELLRKIKRLVDETVEDVERQVTDAASGTESVQLRVRSARAVSRASMPKITLDEVESARSWLATAAETGMLVAEGVAVLEGLLSFAERVVGVID
jgi:hypothetical protein